MDHLFSPIILGVIVSLVIFLFLEKKAIEAKRKAKEEGLHPENATLPETFIVYKTEKNVTIYIISMFIFTVLLSYFSFFTQGLTLIDVFLYIFLTTFIGSVVIFALKFKKSILIKVFASFLYGAPLIFASGLGFTLTYIVYKELM
jgi:hypothetical protein